MASHKINHRFFATLVEHLFKKHGALLYMRNGDTLPLAGNAVPAWVESNFIWAHSYQTSFGKRQCFLLADHDVIENSNIYQAKSLL